MSAAFLPSLSKVREEKGAEAERAFAREFVFWMSLLVLSVSLVGSLSAPWLVKLFASSAFVANEEKYVRAVATTRWVFPYIALMGGAAMLSAMLHSRRRFAAAAIAPTWLNIALIASALVALPVSLFCGVSISVALSMGALMGGILHVLFLIPFLRGSGFSLRPSVSMSPELKPSFALLVPLLFSLGVYQLNMLLSQRFATRFDGAINYLWYGQRIVELPQGLLGVAVSVAALPSLASAFASKKDDELRETILASLSLAFFVALPAGVGACLLTEPLVGVLFARGEFGSHELEMTVYSLRYLALGVPAVAMLRGCLPIFYAMHDTKTPVIASAASIPLYLGLALLLMPSMQHAGLALATSMAAWCQVLLLLFFLLRRLTNISLRELLARFGKSLFPSVAMGIVLALILLLMKHLSWTLFVHGRHMINISMLLTVIGFAVFSYVLVARMVRSEEAMLVIKAVSRRLHR